MVIKDEVWAAIRKAIEEVEYGSVTINLNPTADFVDIQKNERIRIVNPQKPIPGRVVRSL